MRWSVPTLLAAAAFLPGRAASGQAAPEPDRLPALAVTASRTAEAPGDIPVTSRLLTGDTLRQTPAATLDGALRSLPGFSLFRRSDSLTANPTAQGVSLRGLGPSGASRSLVLLDGVPLNDPFGGWVAWTKLPRSGVSHVEVVPGGGASAWGNAALGGVVQVFSAEPAVAAGGNAGSVHALLGDFGTRSVELEAAGGVGPGTLQLFGRESRTDGFRLIAPERRGPVDVPAGSRHRVLGARWRQSLATAELTLTARTYEESRGNGTPYQQNGTREQFVSAAATGTSPGRLRWTATGYLQDQTFHSTFGSVNALRTAETPASDQYAVPALAGGLGWNGNWIPGPGSRTTAGTDLRFVRGETRENYTYTNGGFTRRRTAGGAQTTAGAYVLHDQVLLPGIRGQAGLRADAWRDTAGRRDEAERATGAVLRADRYPDRADVELSPSLGAVWVPAAGWRIRGHAQGAFRRPTLNELYRPFRQGANVTESNPALRTEHGRSLEAGLERTWPGAQPGAEPWLALSAVAFRHQLNDAVGNVTLARGPGTFPIVGALAAGGLGRQRLNLDQLRGQGLELSARWHPGATLTLTGDYLLNDHRVTAARVAPGLVGRRIAQVPRHTAALGLAWQAPGRVRATVRGRVLGRQFEDDENQLRLGRAAVVDVGLARPLTRRLELLLQVENAGDARIETGRGADGVVSTGTPRLALLGLRGTW